MADLIRVSIIGSLPGGEVWSINPIFAFSAPLALSTDELAEAVAAVNAVPIPVGLQNLNVPDVKVTGCRIEARKVTGELEGTAEGLRAVAVGGNSDVGHSFQSSMVLSLRTSDSSARGKGRLYWPATGQLLTTTTLRVPGAGVTNYLSAMNTYLAALRTAVRGVGGMNTAVLAVWSRTALNTKVVLQLRAGDILDVQRRRRDAIPETYQSQAVVAP